MILIKPRQKTSKKLVTIWLIFVTFFLTWIFLNLSEEEMEQNGSWRLDCACAVNRSSATVTSDLNSTCGDGATARGPNQLVVTYSIFGEDENYFDGMARNAELVLSYYPGWVLRFYYHFREWSAEDVRMKLCPIWCDYPHVDFCPVQHLPPPLLRQTALQPRMWRFLVLGDPLVERFMSRDVDSLPTEREVAAVEEWLQSGKTFHFMRDHYYHTDPIMAGMWGAINTNTESMSSLRDELVRRGRASADGHQDQSLLAQIVLPYAEGSGDYVNHDSYLCQSASPNKSQPWPTRRNGTLDYVGRPITRNKPFTLDKSCPPACRPPQHPDWDYC